MRKQQFGVRSSEFGVVALSVVLIAIILSGIQTARAEVANRIIAVVNDDVITESDVTSRLNELLEASDAGPKPDTTQMRQLMLRRLIEQRLILQEAKRMGISVDADDIAARMEKIRRKFDSDETFTASLAATGLTKEQLKEQIREQLTADRLIDGRVRATVTVSPQEVAAELQKRPEVSQGGDRVRASHILVRVSESRSEPAARALIENVHRKLTTGADFAALAKRHSEDPHAEAGGAMDWVAQGQLLPELDAVLFSLKPGELSPPIQTRLGFHLVRVDERRTAKELSLLEANAAVFDELYQRKFQEALRRWMGDLMRKAYIEIVPPTSS